MEIMKMDRQSVLHIVDHDTMFSAGTFLSGESTPNIWEAFLAT